MSIGMVEKERKHPTVTSNVLEFIEDYIVSITDLTRSRKLSEILESFSGKICSDIYIVQNNKNKDAKAVIADLEYFKSLLKYKEAVEDAIDQNMYQIVLERQNEVADIPLAQVLEGENFTLKEILTLAGEIEVED